MTSPNSAHRKSCWSLLTKRRLNRQRIIEIQSMEKLKKVLFVFIELQTICHFQEKPSWVTTYFYPCFKNILGNYNHNDKWLFFTQKIEVGSCSTRRTFAEVLGGVGHEILNWLWECTFWCLFHRTINKKVPFEKLWEETNGATSKLFRLVIMKIKLLNFPNNFWPLPLCGVRHLDSQWVVLRLSWYL